MKDNRQRTNTARREPRRAASTPRTRGGSRKDRTIARLRRELADLRRENAELSRELADLRRELQASRLAQGDQPLRRLSRRVRGEQSRERLMDEAGRRAHHYRKKTFLRYLWESVMESAPVAVIAKLTQYLRRVRVVRILVSLALAVGAVAAVAVLSAAVLPFLFFGTALLTMLAALRSHRMNRILQNRLELDRIRILVPSGKAAFTEGSFFLRNARAMAAEEGVAVVVISPYLVSRRGLGGTGRYFTAREEAEGLYLVRRHYFFTLRRRVLDTLQAEITVIY